ncbi:glycosyltransferase [Candidatus Parcubacteria bacterium]|nr:glycosyltransferase [Candidatus Parcubacteria bacterium]
MQKRYIKLQKTECEKTIKYMVDNYGIPKLIDRLNLYIYNEKNKELQIKFKNKNIFFKENSLNDAYGWVELKNRSIKSFFQTLYNLGFKEFIFGRSETIEFEMGSKLVGSIFKESLKGSFIEFEYTSEDSERNIEELLNKLNINNNQIYNTESFSKIKTNKELEKENLFDNTKRLNKHIREYCVQHGVEIRTDSLTLQSRLEGVSNDYSYLEKSFNDLTGISLVDGNLPRINNNFIEEGISIIIPSYNSHDKLEYTLRSINSQDLNSKQFKSIEVIVVDDFSEINTEVIINKLKLKFNCKSIRLNQNMDVAFARNIGASASSYEKLIFLDSDILISKNYISNMYYRLSVIPNAVFTTFRKNIKLDDFVLKKINKGLDNPKEIDDSRISNKTKPEQVGWEEDNKEVRQFNIFDDTDGFKNLGFGASVGVYDLPGVLSGHNIAISKNNFQKVNGFCTEFKGWGIEDKFFGLSLVTEGNFIIPVTSSMVYHLEYGPRDGDLNKKIKELNNNYDKYKKMLKNIWW